MSTQATATPPSQPADIAADLIQLTQDQASALPAELLAQLRARALESTGAAKELKERWKYTPAKGYFQSMLEHQAKANGVADDPIQVQRLASGCDLQPVSNTNLGEVSALLANDALWQRYPLADLISQTPQAGYLLHIRSSQTEPLKIQLNPGLGFLIVSLAPNVTATLTMQYSTAPGFAGHWIASNLASGAQLNQALLVESNEPATRRWLLNHATLQASSSYTGHVHGFSEGKQRLETHLQLQGQGAQARLTAASITARQASFDHQVVMEHQAPSCESHQRVHNVADGGSKNSFNGRIHIHPGAQGTNAQLQNRNLALAPGAEINTKPELEIYNDNVSCSHGATIGQLDEQALFYLRSRGVPPEQARDLLLRAFIAECDGGALAEAAQQGADRLLSGALG